MKSTYSLLTLYLEKSQEILSFNNDNQSSETLCQSTYERDTEESKLEWKTIDECLETIRPYNLEKKKLIININKVVQEYRLYPHIVL